jgi:galactokinase
MFETHEGLSGLYEVSCRELDFLVAAARDFNEVLGARMMGGGFGGCTINLVKNSVADEFILDMRSKYQKAFSIEMPSYRVNAVEGTGKVPDEALHLST